jgi:hypothetical protein
VIRHTLVSSEAVLLSSIGSIVDADTEAVFVIVPGGGLTCTTMVIVTTAASAIVPTVQVTRPPDSPHEP